MTERIGTYAAVEQTKKALSADRSHVLFDRDEAGKLIVGIDELIRMKSGRTYTKRIWYPTPLEPVPLDPRALKLVAEGARPNRLWITTVLDSHALEGPEVDLALGVAEPTVDWWEQGVLEPSREDLGRLSALTGYSPCWFYRREPPDVRGFICSRGPGGFGCQFIESADADRRR